MIWLLLVLATVPDPALTPGTVLSLTRTQVCSIRWGKDRRHVTEAMKQQVAAVYGLRRSDIKAAGKGPCCEFDHKIPRELAGADDVKNLWPQPWAEAHRKDLRENQLHVAVCNGSITLTAAQNEMRQWGSR